MILHDWACLRNLVSPWYFPFMSPNRFSRESAPFPHGTNQEVISGSFASEGDLRCAESSHCPKIVDVVIASEQIFNPGRRGSRCTYYHFHISHLLHSRLPVFIPVPGPSPLELMWKVTLISTLCISQFEGAVLCLQSGLNVFFLLLFEV